MFQAMRLDVCIIFLAIISRTLCRETACSRFHYEERLLEKMIRQEIHVEEMESKIEKTLQTLTTFMADIEQKLNSKVGDMENKIKENLREVSTNVNNMKQTMETYKDEMADRKNELNILADNLALPRIAFNVYNVKDVANVASTKGNTFIFTTAQLNEGDAYNVNTGVFTAPVAGVYHFSVHMCNFGGKYVHYGIVVDGKTIAASNQQDEKHYSCSSVSTISILQSGSSACIQSTFSSSANKAYQDDDYRHISFNGVLLHK